MNSKAGSWIGGAVLVAALACVAAWFLLLSPRLESVDSLKAETASVNDQNDILELKVEKLKVQFAKLDEYKAEIAAIQIQIPTTALLADYTKQVNEIAQANGVVVTVLAPGAPFEFLPAPPSAPADAPAADATAPAAPAQIPGFVAMPFSMTLVGPYANTQTFLDQLQTGTQRLFLVTALTGGSQPEGEAAGGRPATVVGDIELTVTGYAYVLQDPLAGIAEMLVPGDPVPLPVPAPGANPLLPVAGS